MAPWLNPPTADRKAVFNGVNIVHTAGFGVQGLEVQSSKTDLLIFYSSRLLTFIIVLVKPLNAD